MKNNRKNFLFNFCIVIIFISGCCSVPKQRNNSSTSTKDSFTTTIQDSMLNFINNTDADIVIIIERSTCYGTCPSFRLAMVSSGKVYFEGLAFVKRMGVNYTSYDKDKLPPLVSDFYNSGFLELKDDYNSSDCNANTDFPSITISITTPDTTKKVNYYFGCTNYKKEVKIINKLADSIERIANVKELIE